MTAVLQPPTAYQPLDSDLTAIAGESTEPFGRSLLELVDPAALRSAAVLGSAAVEDKVAAGNAGVLDATDPTTANTRTPTDGSVTDAKVAAGAAIAPSKIAGTAVVATQVGQPNGVASLDSGGLVPVAQIPPLAISDYLGDVASQAAMLALVGQRGDWCTRSDLAATFILRADDPTLLASWKQLPVPTDAVLSVNGRTGVVTGLAEDSTVAHLTGNETIAGVKTFSSAPAVPDASFAEAKVSGLVTDLAGKVALSLVTAKGDLLAGTGAGALARVGAGTAGQVLSPDPAQSAGVGWSTLVRGAGSPIIGAETAPMIIAPANTYNVGTGAIGAWDLCFLAVADTATFDRISINVTAAVAGSLIRLGVMEWPGTLPPTTPSGVWTLVSDAGTVDCSTTGVKSAMLPTPITKRNTLLGLILINQPAVAAVSATLSALRADTPAASYSPFGSVSPNGPINAVVRNPGSGTPLITGAIPSTLDLAPPGSATQWNRVCTIISLRRSA